VTITKISLFPWLKSLSLHYKKWPVEWVYVARKADATDSFAITKNARFVQQHRAVASMSLEWILFIPIVVSFLSPNLIEEQSDGSCYES
jgi:hypothetical protein